MSCWTDIRASAPATSLAVSIAAAAAVAVLTALAGGCGDDGGDGEIDARVDDSLTDDLSMPGEPTISLDNFTPSSECGACHPQHFVEWKTSMHAYAMIDPVYRKLVQMRQAEFDGAQDRFCLQCHTPIGTRAGDVAPGFSFEALSPISLEGVNCETCHRSVSVERPYNSGLLIDDTGPIRGPIQDPLSTEFHLTEPSSMFDTPEFCGSCHDVIEVNGLNLERPFAEWIESPVGGTEQNCQSCHMPTYEGQASIFSQVTQNVHLHRFVGVDLPLIDGVLTPEEFDDLRARISALLTGAATLTIEAAPQVAPGAQLDLFVTIENNISAHNFPTGSTFNRQVWLEVTATDGAGQVLYRTGDLDANGDLRDHFSELDPYGDQDLITLASRLTNVDGAPELFSWRATEHFSNSLSPLYTRTYTLFIPTAADTVGPISISARLRFRSFPPHLLRTIGLPDEADRLEIFDIDTAALGVAVTP